VIPVELLDAFGVSGTIAHVERLTGGHIHGTWAITVADAIGARSRYVAQSLNAYVFADLPACEDNMARIDAHFRAGEAAGADGIAMLVGVPRLRRTAAGAVQWTDTGGTTWRLADYVESTVAGTTARDAGQAHEAGVAFGRYVHVLSSVGGGPLAVTIDRFHDLRWRCQQLDDAVSTDRFDRLRDCRDTVTAARQIAARVIELIDDLPTLPVRSVHNDAKVANVRFDERTGRAVCIVDLDTTMPGTVIYDIGELLRTATTTIAEDDASALDASSVTVDRERVEAVVSGFVDGAGALLVDAERAAMAHAGPLMAAENAIRFLADHLRGDVYFGAEREGHNLDRARTQLAIAEALRQQATPIVERIAPGSQR
jgi:hypothetical protein